MERLKAELEAAPVNPLFTVDEAKDHVRRDDDDDDALITGLVDVVTSRLDGVDGILGRCLITQTWSEQFNGFPASDVLRLALAPLQAVSSIEYYDGDDNLQTMDVADYAAHNRPGYGYVKLGRDASWPSTSDRDDAVKVTYIAGYGDDAADVPPTIRHAAKMLLGEYYEIREDVVTGVVATSLPGGVMTLLRPYIRPHF